MLCAAAVYYEQVLIKDESEDYVDCEYDENSADGDTPLLWEVQYIPFQYFLFLVILILLEYGASI